MEAFTISCDTCAMRGDHVCADCLVTFLFDEAEGGETPPHRGAVVLDLGEERAVRMLASAGLVPTIRHRAIG